MNPHNDYLDHYLHFSPHSGYNGGCTGDTIISIKYVVLNTMAFLIIFTVLLPYLNANLNQIWTNQSEQPTNQPGRVCSERFLLFVKLFILISNRDVMFPNMHNVMFGQLYSYRDYFGHQLSNDCLIGDIFWFISLQHPGQRRATPHSSNCWIGQMKKHPTIGYTQVMHLIFDLILSESKADGHPFTINFWFGFNQTFY